MKNVVKKGLALCLATITFGSLTACGGGGSDDSNDNVLQIAAVRMGYGTAWLDAIAEEFTKETGIKVDKSIKVGQAGAEALDTEIESLASSNDLFFNKRAWFPKSVYEGTISVQGQKYDCLYADISDVWASVVDEGSGKTIEDKVDSTYAAAYHIDNKYYALPWAGGVFGIVRNLDVWESLGLTDADMPYTTDQMFALGDKIKSQKAPFIYSLESEYYSGLLPIWFAQYEGKANTELFLSGKDPDGEMSPYIYTYDGQLEALKVMQKLVPLVQDGGYQHNKSTSIDFTSMQGQFLRGEALFNVNGSWLENEAAANFKDSETDIIKTPVISAIVKKLSFKSLEATAADAKLAEIVKYVDAVDAGESATKPEGVTDEDIQIVTEARHYAYVAGGIDHQAYIPSYSNNIDAAKEFLKFMYSDKGLNIYYNTLNGATLPAMPVKAYENTSLELSTFRKSVNVATEEGFVYDRLEKVRFYVLPQVSTTFANGVKPINALVAGSTPESIIATNSSDIESKWNSIQQLLGIK